VPDEVIAELSDIVPETSERSSETVSDVSCAVDEV